MASSNVYQITGKEIYVSGFTPSQGSEGSAIQISGTNFEQVTQVNFRHESPLRSNILAGDLSPTGSGDWGGGSAVTPISDLVSADFRLTGTTGLIVYVPPMVRGVASLSYEGRPFGAPMGAFNVVTRGPSVQYDIIPTGDAAPTNEGDRNVNYTIEEDVGGTVFLVTRTKFPDGSTLIVSSVPKS